MHKPLGYAELPQDKAPAYRGIHQRSDWFRCRGKCTYACGHLQFRHHRGGCHAEDQLQEAVTLHWGGAGWPWAWDRQEAENIQIIYLGDNKTGTGEAEGEIWVGKQRSATNFYIIFVCFNNLKRRTNNILLKLNKITKNILTSTIYSGKIQKTEQVQRRWRRRKLQRISQRAGDGEIPVKDCWFLIPSEPEAPKVYTQ